MFCSSVSLLLKPLSPNKLSEHNVSKAKENEVKRRRQKRYTNAIQLDVSSYVVGCVNTQTSRWTDLQRELEQGVNTLM